MAQPVCITGVGVVSAFGDSPRTLRDALLSGKSGIAPSREFEEAGCTSVLASRVAGFDPASWIPPMKLRRMDVSTPFAIVAIQQAMEGAGYTVRPEGDERTGVVLGTYSAGGGATSEYLAALFTKGPLGAPALLFNSTVANAAAGLAGLEFKLQGPNATISQKEASGLAAVAAAVDLLRADRADAIAAGGMDAVYELFYRVHDRFGVLNRDAAPGSSSAPFSTGRRGFVMGEGGFALWLERRDACRDRVARTCGEILGVGASSAAVRLNAWPVRPEPLVRTMRLALEDAGVSPSEIGVVFASANASALDGTEASALAEVFGEHSPAITSVKGALGESAASGAAACVAAVLCGRLGAVPPISGLAGAGIDPAAAGLDIVVAPRTAPPGLTLVNSFASGGSLVSAVLRVDH